ncbi:hypothetical protein RRG08_045408 [Elysia crispata]|uniref:Uncharacterized protein n=1 Tax=Elysia crispata TaxID=231223 RepID=A0AAE1CIN8_9GAST|nr:hypothetical protein RRG08_045408 [Elysia crispata]
MGLGYDTPVTMGLGYDTPVTMGLGYDTPVTMGLGYDTPVTMNQCCANLANTVRIKAESPQSICSTNTILTGGVGLGLASCCPSAAEFSHFAMSLSTVSLVGSSENQMTPADWSDSVNVRSMLPEVARDPVEDPQTESWSRDIKFDINLRPSTSPLSRSLPDAVTERRKYQSRVPSLPHHQPGPTLRATLGNREVVSGADFPGVNI